MIEVGTWNVGNGSIADARELMSTVSVLAMQEASDQDKMIAALREDGYGIIRPQRKVGQPATPLIFNKRDLHCYRRFSVPLYSGGPIGAGTGPDDGKPKFLNGGKFIYKPTSTKVAFASIHTYPGQKFHPTNKRQHVSEEMVRKAVTYFETYRAIAFIMGDFNTNPDTETTLPLRRESWSWDQLTGDRLGTHGSWSPDQIWWRNQGKRHCKFVHHKTVANGSDHDALIASLQIG